MAYFKREAGQPWVLVVLGLCVVGLVVGGCAWEMSGPGTVEEEKRTRKVRLEKNRLEAVRKRARELEHLQCLLVAQAGKTKLEYYDQLAPGEPVNIKSASKSVLSALVGLALEAGALESVNQELHEFFPQLLAGAPVTKQEIRLRDLLVMRSGLETTSFHNYGDWVATDNWLRAALRKPLKRPPGEATRYSTGNSHILGAALAEALERDLKAYAQARLFGPLGVVIHHWQRSPEGYRFGGNNLSLTPRGMLRFGQLYLNKGQFNGQQVVPAKWVKRSTRPQHADTKHGYPYGFFWWNTEFGGARAFFAWGHGGQYIFVVPAHELVVVTATDLQASNERNGMREVVHGIVGEIVMK